jgi:hypothetical protein
MTDVFQNFGPSPGLAAFLTALCPDVQVRIVSFLTVKDARFLMTTQKHFLNLIKDSKFLWQLWCHQQWPYIPDTTEFVLSIVGYEHTCLWPFARILSLAADGPKCLNLRLANQIYRYPVFRYTGSAIRCLGIQEDDVVDDAPWISPSRYRSYGITALHPLPRPHKERTPFVVPLMDEENKALLKPEFLSYFEISILKFANSGTKDVSDRKALTIAIGLNSYPMLRDCNCHCGLCGYMPGWDEESWGYHGDDGGLHYNDDRSHREYGPTYGEGDTIGCGVDYQRGHIFFTLNGRYLGIAWHMELEMSRRMFYPTLAMREGMPPIECNFGEHPFRFQLGNYNMVSST